MTAAIIDPGQLNRRLILEEMTETPDGAGGVTRSIQTVGALWAQVTPFSASNDVEAESAGITVNYQIIVRAGFPITANHRLRDGSRIFRILAVRDADREGRFLGIRAEMRTS